MNRFIKDFKPQATSCSISIQQTGRRYSKHVTTRSTHRQQPKLRGNRRQGAQTDLSTHRQTTSPPDTEHHLSASLSSLSSADEVLETLEHIPLCTLLSEASAVRDSYYRQITFSAKVFIPLTQLCSDSCGYCTFARGPSPGRRAYMTLSEVLEVARLGADQGCTEALFTLGDKPELKYPEAAAELKAMGMSSTLEYVKLAAEVVLQETGLLPHINAGVMDAASIRDLKSVSVSQGLMLESTALDLLLPGGAHYDCPDKDPAVRLETIEAAGREGVPFTTGILIGIGETRKDRIEALLAIKELHQRYGHIQEIIIQNFKAKQNTLMELWPEPPIEELLWTIAVARVLMPPEVSIQAPPNLTPEPDDANNNATTSTNKSSTNEDANNSKGNASWKALIDAGINDFGGISPVTRDFVNPEKPWPHLKNLAAVTAEAGFALVPRLPIYPHYIQNIESRDRWLHGGGGRSSPLAATLRHADALGLARASTWVAGAAEEEGNANTIATATASSSVFSTNNISSSNNGGIITIEPSEGAAAALKRHIPAPRLGKSRTWQVIARTDGVLVGVNPPKQSSWVTDLLQSVLEHDYELTENDIIKLFGVRGHDFDAVCTAADQLRRRVNGNTVTYVVNRNINYTNVCTYGCKFCAFSKGPASEDLRGAPYLLDIQEIKERTVEAWERGAGEVCMQGGIHPDFTGQTYLDILSAVKEAVPEMHVHAFSPLEVSQGAATMGWTLEKYLTELKNAGLGSLPGTAAEILDDTVRKELCPDKLSTSEWLHVLETAHSVGLKTTSTIMFGHIDSPLSWARHLVALRDLQRRTGGITEFVPLPFVHMQAPIYRSGRSRAGPTLRECILMHAIGRLALHPYITNIQASWVKMGPERAAGLLQAGCNDMGGVLMNESITRAAGAAHGQEVSAPEMERLICDIPGRVAKQRTTVYGIPNKAQVAVSLKH